MTIPEINALADTIARSDPRDPEVQAQNLESIRHLRVSMERGGATDLLPFLDTAGVLVEALSHIGDLGPEEVLKISARLVAMVEDAFQGPSAPVPLQQPSPPAPVASPPPHTRPQPVHQFPAVDIEHNSLRLMQELFLGEILIQMGVVTKEQVDKALSVQRATGLRVGEALVQAGHATWDDVRKGVEFQERLRQSTLWQAG